MRAFQQKALGILINRAGDGPWRSKSVFVAFAAVVIGLGLWVSDLKNGPPQSETSSIVTNVPTVTSPANAHWHWSKPFPFYVPVGASYMAGFCIGWVFRKLIRVILAFTALVIALLALGKFTGCDMTPAQERVKHTGEWARHEETAAEDCLMPVLPSATAGGAGIFLGFRRRSKVAALKSGTETNPPPQYHREESGGDQEAQPWCWRSASFRWKPIRVPFPTMLIFYIALQGFNASNAAAI
ncbi:MAG: hypothetical protein ACLPRE_03125 [Limisphaerales bacterium]